MKALFQLTGDELEALANALVAGRVPIPVSHFALRRVVTAATESLVAEVAELIVATSATGTAMTLRLLAQQRKQLSQATPELVWTGPDATTSLRDTAIVASQLFARAKRTVLLAGFVVVNGKSLFRALAQRLDAEPEFSVTMFVNVKHERGAPDDSVLAHARDFKNRQWPGRRLPVVYYDPRALEASPRERAVLHAKCIVVDGECALVTSANFTPHAQRRNIELGVMLESVTFAQQIEAQFRTLVNAKTLHRLPGT